MHTTIIMLPDLDGRDCVADIVNVIHDLPGIDNVEVVPETGVVSVAHSPLVSGDDICQALEDAGFPAQR